MSRALLLSWLVERLAEAPRELGLVGRWTALLVLVWGAHAALGGCNPRWRVALWRSVAFGLAVVALFAIVPPVLTWRLPRVASTSAPVTVAHEGDRFQAPPSASTPVLDPFPLRSERKGDVATSPGGGLSDAPARGGRAVPLGLGLLTIWLVGVIVLAGRLARSVGRLARVVRHAEDAPEGVIAESRAIAARLGVTRGVRVMQSPAVLTPCLAGSRRPVLLLPERLCRDAARADLPAVLAHELAHVRGDDLLWNDLWHFISLVLWFHPLIWKVRAAHAAACDSVCDAVATDLLGDVALYVRTLARLALQVAGPPPALGLTMARTSDVRRRIQALERKVFSRSLSRRFVMPVQLAFGVLVVLIGGLGFAPADTLQDAKSETPPAEGRVELGAPIKKKRMVIRVVADKTGTPLEGVSVSSFISFKNQDEMEKAVVKTDGEGKATVEWPEHTDANQLDVIVKKFGYVGVRKIWDDKTHAFRTPETEEFRLEPGVPVAGVVEDEAGRPVGGAKVRMNFQPGESETTRFGLTLGSVDTDEQGRWRFDDAPESLADVRVLGIHANYRLGSSTRSEGREIRVVLTKGLTVKGRVVNGAGDPVKGAEVGNQFWYSILRRVSTNERGEFMLKGQRPGPTAVIVQGEGYAPELHEIDVAPNEETTTPEFRLEPGSVLRVKVVDRAGKPIAGAFCHVSVWREQQIFLRIGRTDAEGRLIWNQAPRDTVEFDIDCDGYMSAKFVPLIASAEEHVVTLKPELRISGRVTDAVTGEPIPRFRVFQGFEESDVSIDMFLLKSLREDVRKIEADMKKFGLELGPTTRQPFWPKHAVADATEGSYLSRFRYPRQAHFIRIEAPGYRPADSRAFRPDEGAQTLDFSLVRD